MKFKFFISILSLLLLFVVSFQANAVPNQYDVGIEFVKQTINIEFFSFNFDSFEKSEFIKSNDKVESIIAVSTDNINNKSPPNLNNTSFNNKKTLTYFHNVLSSKRL